MVMLLVLALVACEVGGVTLPWPRLAALFRRASRRRGVVGAALLSLPLLLWAQLAVFDRATLAQAVTESFRGPVPVLDDRHAATVMARVEPAIELLMLGCFMSLALAFVSFAPKIRWPALPLTCGALIAVALLPHALTSADVYAYVGDALLGPRAYTPPSVPFGAGFSAINAWWGTPIPATTYGPLWIAINTAGLWPFATLFAKIEALRVAGAVLVVATALLIGKATNSHRLVRLVLLSPPLYVLYVVNAHNDLLMLDVTLLAFIAAGHPPSSRGRFATIVFGTAAGLMKIPYAGLTAFAFDRERSPVVRLGLALAIVVLVGGISFAIGGAAIVRAFTSYAATKPAGFGAVKVAVELVAALSLAWTFLTRRRLGTAMLAFPSLGFIALPWYCVWAIPYALGDRLLVARYLIALPLVTYMYESTVWNEPEAFIALLVAVGFLARRLVRWPYPPTLNKARDLPIPPTTRSRERCWGAARPKGSVDSESSGQ